VKYLILTEFNVVIQILIFVIRLYVRIWLLLLLLLLIIIFRNIFLIHVSFLFTNFCFWKKVK